MKGQGQYRPKQYLVTKVDLYGNVLSDSVLVSTKGNINELRTKLIELSGFEEIYKKYCAEKGIKTSATGFKNCLEWTVDDAFNGATMYYTCELPKPKKKKKEENLKSNIIDDDDDFSCTVPFYLLIENIEKMKQYNLPMIGRLA